MNKNEYKKVLGHCCEGNNEPRRVYLMNDDSIVVNYDVGYAYTRFKTFLEFKKWHNSHCN